MSLPSKKRASECSVFPSGTDTETNIEYNTTLRLGAVEAEAANDERPNKLQKRYKPPRLPVGVNISIDSNGSKPECAVRPFCLEASPWERLKRFTKEGKKGKTCLAYEIDSSQSIVAVKREAVANAESVGHLLKTSHKNLVNLLCSFIHQNDLYLGYERMDITLEQLHSDVMMEEPHISFICREVGPQH